jgi:hypothetical protein
VTATVDSITAGETKTFFTASKNCIVKVKPMTTAGNSNQLYINGTSAAALGSVVDESTNVFTNLSDREELFLSHAKYKVSQVYYDSLLLLLKPGDELQLRCGSGTYTNVQYKIYVYEWE